MAALALLLLPAGPSAAFAAEPPKGLATAKLACGSSTRDAITAAEKALSVKSPEAERRALVCLLAAVKALEAERLDEVRGEDKARMLRVPRNP